MFTIITVMKVSLYVVRHGQTHANARGVLQGHQDSPLTALGVQSSANTGKALQGISFSVVRFEIIQIFLLTFFLISKCPQMDVNSDLPNLTFDEY